jgi:hypothetical protein
MRGDQQYRERDEQPGEIGISKAQIPCPNLEPQNPV